MTTMTWSASAPVTAQITTTVPGFNGVQKTIQFLKTSFRLIATNDSAFRGLDLNGNAMWDHGSDMHKQRF